MMRKRLVSLGLILFIFLTGVRAQEGAATQQVIDKKFVLQNEADVWDATLSSYTGIAKPATSFGTVFSSGNLVVPYGFIANVSSITFSSDAACNIAGYFAKAGFGRNNSKLRQSFSFVFGTSGGTSTINFGSDGEDFFEEGGIYFTASALSTVTPTISIVPIAKLYTADLHFEAKFVYGVIGNSIGWTCMGLENGTGKPNLGLTHFSARLTTALRNEGIDIRRTNRAFGGAVAEHWVQGIKSGMYDRSAAKWNLCTINLGTNEATNGNASSQNFSSDIQYILDFLFSQNGSMAVVLLGPPNSDAGGRLDNLQSYRKVLEDIVSLEKYQKRDLKYYDMATNIDLAKGDNYTETLPGTKLHLRGDTGHRLVYEGLLRVVRTTLFYNKNLLSR